MPVSYTYKDEECDVCEIAFKVTKKCKNCDMKYKIEIKQEIDNQETSKLKNVCTTVKTLKIVLKSEAGDIQIPLEVNIKCELGMISNKISIVTIFGRRNFKQKNCQ